MNTRGARYRSSTRGRGLEKLDQPDGADQPDERGRLDWLDWVGLAVIALWLAWVVTASILTERLEPSGPLVTVPLVAVAGVAVGRRLAARATTWPLAEVLFGIGAFFLLAAAMTRGPGKLPTHYANANGAFGVQLLALVALLALSHPRQLPGADGLAPETRAAYLRANRRVLGLAALAAVGVVLINGSIASLVVLGPVALIALVAALSRRGPWRAVSVLGGIGAVAAGVAGLGWLVTHEGWPAVATRGLSTVRQRLWQDAVGLWLAHPVTGGGPGSYVDANRFGSDPDTAAAHSSVLQVGAELGLVGVGLLGVLWLVGFGLAARRSRAAAVIASAAWAALAVHSLIDHLYEFWTVTFTAALVLGWASSEQLDVAERERPVGRRGRGRREWPGREKWPRTWNGQRYEPRRRAGP